ncbi:unnamed protein product [Sphagnum balticum]
MAFFRIGSIIEHGFYSYHNCSNTYNFYLSDTASNTPSLVGHLRFSDFDNGIELVLFIYSFFFRHKLLNIFYLDIHHLYADSQLLFLD